METLGPLAAQIGLTLVVVLLVLQLLAPGLGEEEPESYVSEPPP